MFFAEISTFIHSKTNANEVSNSDGIQTSAESSEYDSKSRHN